MPFLIYDKIADQPLTSIKDEIISLIDKGIAEIKEEYEERGWRFDDFSLKSWNDMASVGVDGLLVNIALNLIQLKKPKSYKNYCEMCSKEMAFLEDSPCDKKFVSQIPEIIWNARFDFKRETQKRHSLSQEEYEKLVSFGQLFHKSRPLLYRIMSSNILAYICIIASILIWIKGFASSREGYYSLIFSFPIIIGAFSITLLAEDKKFKIALIPLGVFISSLLILILIIFFLSWWESDWFIINHRIYPGVIYYDLNLYDLRKTITILFIPVTCTE